MSVLRRRHLFLEASEIVHLTDAEVTHVFLPEARLIASGGFDPAISSDGKLLAYSIDLGDAGTQILVQQTGGEQATPVTTGSIPNYSPDFSPDGTRIVFCREKTGIYVTPTLPGEPKLLVANTRAMFPRFSPHGDSILYLQDERVFTVSSNGGKPVDLTLNLNFQIYGPPLWSPDGNEILFYGTRSDERSQPGTWWTVPLGSGQPRAIVLPAIADNLFHPISIRAWNRPADGSDYIVYSTGDLKNWQLWRARMSARAAVSKNPQLLASGAGGVGLGSSVSKDGRFLYSTLNTNESIFKIPINSRGQKTGPTTQILLPEDGTYASPAITRDGARMAYLSANRGKHNTVLVRDLAKGTDHLVDEMGRTAQRADYMVAITPDASRVIFERDCDHGVFPEDHDSPFPCSFIDSPNGGEAEQICERCRPRGFSSDGSVLLIEKFDLSDGNKDQIVALNLRTRTEKPFLSDPTGPLYNAYFSPDDQWVVFRKTVAGDIPPSQIYIASVRHGSVAPKAEWIAVTDTPYSDDKPRFSADGNSIFFTSTRDGYLCVWAQKLDIRTKNPVGQPFVVEHFHNSAGHFGTQLQRDLELSVAEDCILMSLPQVHSGVWITEMP